MGKRARVAKAEPLHGASSGTIPAQPASVLAHDTETLVGQAEAASGKRRKLKPQNTEEQVSRMIYDHFRDWDASAVDGRFLELWKVEMGVRPTLNQYLAFCALIQNSGTRAVSGDSSDTQSCSSIEGPQV